MKALKSIILAILTLSVLVSCNNEKTDPSKTKETATKSHWPNGAQLVISVSMQFETGGQPEGAESPFSGTPLPKGQPDLPAESWYRYGANEGLGRMMDLWKKYDIKVTSHVVGAAAMKYPEIAKRLANEGHELAAHGMAWDDQWNKSSADELKFVKDGVDAVEKISGQRAVGYNCNWLRRSPNTLKVLQELGFIYHIDDLSRDEPFVTKVKGKNFVVMPYTLRNNDIVQVAGNHWSPDQFLSQLKHEFDQLYEEGATKRRMMSISFHDRIGGTPAMVHAMDEFIKYTHEKTGIVYMRKDDIAKMVINEANTLQDNSEAKFNN
ncbi:polysaccharide deacetylase family protein [Pedobacter sp. MC2016-05]|uniref:polysaccharide deacetylase family protein n=1 Tax=Pedobacter sp. MC2016-05 TaxID=2994474 RepID=UPI002247A0C0|nr:polysaccharide deacetylase family protein [Pedobacter sp. MC2016-05]MCX2477319.1 polysaccharide deacetylase family protein [Pedobacter sp. MC2016-05]